MYFPPGERVLGDIVKKVEKGERITPEEGIRLLQSNDLLAIGYMANLIREKKHGHNTYFMCSDDEKNDCYEATLSYGGVQTIESIVRQLIKLREEQDSNGAFKSFAAHLCDSNDLPDRPTGVDDLKLLAVARIILDNFPHIKVNWLILGAKLMQVSLAFGADEIDGPIVSEKSAPAKDKETQQVLTANDVVKIIKLAGRKPIERDALYNNFREVL